MSQDHEYMDTGALTSDAVPEPQPKQPPVEAPGSPAAQQDEQLEAPAASSLPPGAYAEAKPQE